ncbi:MAG: hypothetical protein U0V87_16535 [Acidobacteriota bacterium]
MNRMAGLLVITVLLLTNVAHGGDDAARRALVEKAQKLFRASRFEEAIEVYRQVLETAPHDWEANYRIALAYTVLYHPGSTDPLDKEYVDKATAGFEALLQMTPPSPEDMDKVRNYYMAVLDSSEQYDKAIEYCRMLLEAQPNDISTLERLAVLYYEKQKVFTPAMQVYEKLAELDPKNRERWFAIGQRYWNRSYVGSKEETISIDERQRCIDLGMRAMDEALRLDQNYLEALAYYGLLWHERSQVLQMLGDTIGADEARARAEDLKQKVLEVTKRRKSGEE